MTRSDTPGTDILALVLLGGRGAILALHVDIEGRAPLCPQDGEFTLVLVLVHGLWVCPSSLAVITIVVVMGTGGLAHLVADSHITVIGPGVCVCVCV